MEVLPDYAIVGGLDLRTLPPVFFFFWIGSTSGKCNSMIQLQDGFCGCWRVKMTVMVRSCLSICSRMDSCTLWMKKCPIVFTPLKLYAPLAIKRSLLEYHHDHPLAGHLGMTKTIVRLKIRFYWPKLSSNAKHMSPSVLSGSIRGWTLSGSYHAHSAGMCISWSSWTTFRSGWKLSR